jgi:hypothetical protein
VCYERFSHAPASYWEDQHQTLFARGQVTLREVGQVTNASNTGQVPRAEDAEASAKAFDTSMRYQMAMQMEMLSTMDFPGNNRENGTVTIFRTEFPQVMRIYGLDVPDQPAPPLDSDPLLGTPVHMRRSTYDSGSIYSPVTVTGSTHTTTQEVPYHRVMGSFLLGANSTSPQSCLYTDLMHEVIFMTEGLPSRYVGNGADIQLAFNSDYQPPPAPQAASPSPSAPPSSLIP